MIDWQGMWNDDQGARHLRPTHVILYIFSFFYRLLVISRNWLYDKQVFTSVNLSCPVISVGNITVGGTGKTPCVIMLAKILQKNGFNPAVLSRGYGGKKAKKVNVVSDGSNIILAAEVAGDEPLMIARALPGVPVITGAKRTATGSAAVRDFGANIIICDDAFQHRKIARDINIVLLDYERPFSNGLLLPAGALREPPGSLKRADCLIITRVDEKAAFDKDAQKIADSFQVDVFLSRHVAKDVAKGDGAAGTPITALQGKKVCAFCGIAQPDSFRKMLLDARAEIISFDAYPDHYAYHACDVGELKDKFIKYHADYLMTTEKDAVRLEKYPDFIKMLSILRMEMEIMPSEKALENFLLRRVCVV